MAPVASPPDPPIPPQPGERVRDWILVALTAVFVGLYVAALLGWIEPRTDNQVVLRLEPIIAVIIGYYFGRIPGERNEKTLKEQVAREERKAGEAEEKKEEAQRGEAYAGQARAALEQKVKSAKAALAGGGGAQGGEDRLPANLSGNAAANEGAARQRVAAALAVLDA